MAEVKVGKYRHYKGNLYEVLGTAKHSETEEEFVVYRALYDNQGLWIRAKEMFMETVRIENREVLRFEFINEKE